MVPNIYDTVRHKMKTRNHPRHGTHYVINLEYQTNRNPTQFPQENGITVFGPHLYSLLPKYLRDVTEKLNRVMTESQNAQLHERVKKQQHPRSAISSYLWVATI